VTYRKCVSELPHRLLRLEGLAVLGGGPIGLAVGGAISGERLLTQLGLIWLAHIGADRLLGYGLKYPTSFKDTHLQRI
jgi:Domain of unknown function (DUF4260)